MGCNPEVIKKQNARIKKLEARRRWRIKMKNKWKLEMYFLKPKERCEHKKTDFWCVLPNGSEIDVNIKEAING